ncbi:MAG TPA: lipid-binding SYLF domain-containing protein [Urbifossiella sp.]|nr:lipid-binding SYLF domain-containing protein [Urbifossiella sp.]
MGRFFPTLLVLAILPAPAIAGPTETLRSATEVLTDLATTSGIPPAALADAHAVAVFPRLVTAGLVVGGRSGHGVLLTRDRDGRWGEPVFVDIGGASVGLQAGVEAADVVLVFTTRQSLDRLLAGKKTLGAGAAGPGGRRAGTAIAADVLTFSRGRGLFVGVSLDGVVIRPDAAANASFARDTRPAVRELVGSLRARIVRMGSPAGEPVTSVADQSPAATVSVSSPAGGIGVSVAINPDQFGVGLSALAAAVVGLMYRATRQKVGRRWGLA